MRKTPMFEEIRNDYLCEDFQQNEGDIRALITIDGWEPGCEDGHVIASVILSKSGDILVCWHDNGARMNEPVLRAIEEAKARLQEIKKK